MFVDASAAVVVVVVGIAGVTLSLFDELYISFNDLRAVVWFLLPISFKAFEFLMFSCVVSGAIKSSKKKDCLSSDLEL